MTSKIPSILTLCTTSNLKMNPVLQGQDTGSVTDGERGESRGLILVSLSRHEFKKETNTCGGDERAGLFMKPTQAQCCKQAPS